MEKHNYFCFHGVIDKSMFVRFYIMHKNGEKWNLPVFSILSKTYSFTGLQRLCLTNFYAWHIMNMQTEGVLTHVG